MISNNYKYGQGIWVVGTGLLPITKIGRKWITLGNNQLRFDLATFTAEPSKTGVQVNLYLSEAAAIELAGLVETNF